MADNKITFYMNPQSRSRIIRWMLEEVGAAYETKVIQYGTEMKSEPYISINPMGKVPAIVHKGQVVTECPAICAYLADVFPEANLAPSPEQKAPYYRWLFFAAGPLEAAITNKALGFEISPEKGRTAGYGSFETTISTLIKAVSASTYVAGETFTAADVYVGSHVGWGLQFGTLPKKPELIAYFDRLKTRPAYIKGDELDNALVK